ncbi:MAG: hypothetical protein V1859_09615 [archaeon]
MKPELNFILCSDTEDNHPKYLPGWEKEGSDYDEYTPTFKYTWTNHWNELLAEFNKYDLKIIWFLRTDLCIKDSFLKYNKRAITHLKEAENILGIHIHTLSWDGRIWCQEGNESKQSKIVEKSIRIFTDTLDFHPLYSRMGWNAMTNSIMHALAENGIRVDMTCAPGYFSEGMYGGRDNIIDWRNSPLVPYRPCFSDYKKEGNMDIVEIPISTINNANKLYKKSRLNSILNKHLHKPVAKIVSKSGYIIDRMNYNPHSCFTISPFWSNKPITEMIRKKHAEAEEKGSANIIGYFHPCDILNTQNGKINKIFMKSIAEILSEIYNGKSTVRDARYINQLLKGV